MMNRPDPAPLPGQTGMSTNQDILNALKTISGQLATLIQIASNVDKLQIYNGQVIRAGDKLKLPDWSIPPGMFLGVTNRSTNIATALVSIRTLEDGSNFKELSVGAQAFYRVNNLKDLVVSGDTVGMIVEFDVERR